MSQATSDPTIATLKKFDDPNLWHIERGVPVFDAHAEYDAAGRLLRRFGVEELVRIAANCNRRERDTGDACPITEGHTRVGAPESAQPAVLGFARNFRVGRFGPSRRLALLADFYIDRACLPVARKYPRRSIELYLREMIIDPIALLVRTPGRDLGLLTFSQHSQRIRYKMEDTDVDDKPLAIFTQEENHTADLLTPEQEELAERFWSYYQKHKLDAQELQPRDSSVPQSLGLEETQTAVVDDKERMRREQEALRFAQTEARIVELERALVAEQRASRRSARERDLIQLEVLGYQFDRAEEIEHVADLPADKYAKHLDRIQKYHQRAPVGALLATPSLEHWAPGDLARGNGKRYGKEQVARAVQYVTDHPEVSYEEALEKVG